MGTGTIDGAIYNTAIGYNALTDITSGQGNTCIGMNAGDDITDGEFNVIIGQSTGATTTSADKITAVGADAMNRDITADGIGSVAVGYAALQLLTEGIGNVAIGYQALTVEDDGDFNTAVGHQALTAQTGTSGTVANTAVGYQAGSGLTTATGTTAIGYKAGGAATLTGNVNTLIGSMAGSAITSGAYNTIVGADAGDAFTTGDKNTAVGYRAMGAADGEEDDNTAVGEAALGQLSGDAAEDNVAVGKEAGWNLTTGNSNTIIGATSQPSGGGAVNQTVVGHGATGQADNSVTLGNTSVESLELGDKFQIISNQTGYDDDSATNIFQVHVENNNYHVVVKVEYLITDYANGSAFGSFYVTCHRPQSSATTLVDTTGLVNNGTSGWTGAPNVPSFGVTAVSGGNTETKSFFVTVTYDSNGTGNKIMYTATLMNSHTNSGTYGTNSAWLTSDIS